MNGIYLTQEAKQEIEAKIAELELKRDEAAENEDEIYVNCCIGQIFAYYVVLQSAMVLPEAAVWIKYINDTIIPFLKEESPRLIITKSK